MPTLPSSVHRRTVIGVLSVGHNNSSPFIVGHNEVFVVFEEKEEKRLRIVGEDGCAVPQVQRQDDYNGQLSELHMVFLPRELIKELRMKLKSCDLTFVWPGRAAIRITISFCSLFGSY